MAPQTRTPPLSAVTPLLRANDVLHPEQDAAALLALSPGTADALALGLSAATSLFYGLLLQGAAETCGADAVDPLSRTFFRRLGRAKAAALRAGAPGSCLQGDVRDLVTVLIAAIYDASPEFTFRVDRYEPGGCEIVLGGVDRYFRAATQVGLVDQLTWPVLHPFFEGIRDELCVPCTVESRLLERGEGARLVSAFAFRSVPAMAPRG